MTAADRSRQETRRRALQDAVHVFALSGLAVAQPMLDRLAGRTQHLADEGITAGGLLCFVLLALVAVPAALLVVEAIGAWFAVRARVHVAVMGTLFVLLALAVVQRIIDLPSWRGAGIPGAAVLLVAAACGVAATYAYVRWDGIRRLMTFAAAGPAIFPAALFWNPDVRAAVAPPPRPSAPRLAVENPAPVVMVVFDEFCGMSLLNERREIDAARYPNFARLSQSATWYRNASSVHPRTDQALPAMLSGNYPAVERLPFAEAYPQNLFALVHRTQRYDVSIFEPFTRLAPPELALTAAPQRGPLDQARRLFGTAAAVTANGLMPSDVPVPLPAIPRAWFGLRDAYQIDRARRTGLLRYPWDYDRDLQFAHFLDCLGSGGSSEFRFLHVALPHYPWCYLPDGTRTVLHPNGKQRPLGARGEFGELWGNDELASQQAWQRYLLQVGYADRLIGQLLDRLESTGLLDRCLLIVTADHGVSFLPGQSRRAVTGPNLPDLVSVPLFVKPPGQRRGETSDRNVETIDLLPTIAGVLGLELPAPVDGNSLFDETSPPRPRKLFHSEGTSIPIEPTFAAKETSLDRMLALFGSGTQADRLGDSLVRPDLVGRSLAEFPLDEDTETEIVLSEGCFRFDRRKLDYLPCALEGWIVKPPPGEPVVTLAVAVNGTIATVTRTLRERRDRYGWAAFVPESAFGDGENVIELLRVDDSQGVRLSRCRTFTDSERPRRD